MKPSKEQSIQHSLVDLAVIGAGPHALTIMAKLLEIRIDPMEETPLNKNLFEIGTAGRIKSRFSRGTPAQVGTSLDKDMHRFINDGNTRQAKDRRKKIMERCVVIDPNEGGWMAQWEMQFQALGIRKLRSSTSVHPDPIDSDMMRFYAEQHHSRESDFSSIDLNKTDSYHGPFEVPSTELFTKFCKSIVRRYDLDQLLRKARVTRIIPFKNDGEKEENFHLYLDDGSCICARQVVVATGSLSKPSFPDWALEALEQNQEFPKAVSTMLHSNDFITISDCKRGISIERDVLTTTKEDRNPSLLVVGGGLTAAHLIIRLLHTHPNIKITSLTRSEYRVRQFDLDLKWFGTHRTSNLAAFWNEKEMESRATMLKDSKNGGSITPEVQRELKNFETNGRLCIISAEEIVEAWWNENNLSDPNACNCWSMRLSNGQIYDFDAIVCATGTEIDFCTDPLFSDIISYTDLQDKEISVTSGIPIVTEELRVSENLNVFVTGSYAALRIGPGAANLMGARAAAARIVPSLKLVQRDFSRKARGKEHRQLQQNLNASKSNKSTTISNELELQKSSWHSYQSIVFGRAEWNKFFGDIGEEPPLPADIEAILHSPCPYFQGKKVIETHLLVLVPQTVNKLPLTLNLLEELVQMVNSPGHSSKFRFYEDAIKRTYGDCPSSPSHWILMMKAPIPGTENKWRDDAVKYIKKPYQIPSLLQASTAILLHFVQNRERLCSYSDGTYFYCQEAVDLGVEHGFKWTSVGSFGPGGLHISHCLFGRGSIAALRCFAKPKIYTLNRCRCQQTKALNMQRKQRSKLELQTLLRSPL